jgi:hypothetical protein
VDGVPETGDGGVPAATTVGVLAVVAAGAGRDAGAVDTETLLVELTAAP